MLRFSRAPFPNIVKGARPYNYMAWRIHNRIIVNLSGAGADAGGPHLVSPTILKEGPSCSGIYSILNNGENIHFTGEALPFYGNTGMCPYYLFYGLAPPSL